ncbi:MAG TPA: oligogalacturonate lyase family protein [Opitutaceae bacterium]|nr:oligogalacturonate lyase family protein [Opitutaceae bacterium]
MRPPLHLIAFLTLIVSPMATRATDQPATEWIDPATGHRVVQLSREPGTASLYFNQNAYTADGTRLIVTTPHGISTINLSTREITPIVEGRVRVIMAGRKSGDVYYTKRGDTGVVVYATNVDTRATREIAKLPRGEISSINADETLMLGLIAERPPSPSGSRPEHHAGPDMANTAAAQPNAAGANPTFQANYRATRADGTPMTFAEAKDLALHNRLMAIRRGPPQTIFTLNIKTGEIRNIVQQREWLGHLQFSPTDPNQIMFCHEGTWHEVDRIWLVRTDGTGLTDVHRRTMNMEIAGHEFFGPNGRTIWYDLQTPRGVDFWLAGYEIASRRRTWYHLTRNEWSVHYNVSPDGKLFCGDGGDDEMVAHAKDGKWIYLFRPERVPDVAGVRNPESASLIDAGVFRAERLVNMARHNYRLEPNVSFTPDMKWIVFRSNMSGAVQTYAVEVARAK